MLSAIWRTSKILAITATVSACGTIYTLPEVMDGSVSQATRMFQETPAGGMSQGPVQPGAERAASNFVEVAERVEPVAERFCETETAEIEGFNCDVRVVIDERMPYRNAYQTYADDGTPIVAFTLPMVADARNRDEIAFVLGHEFGHHIARHIQKKQQQGAAGALILGTIMAAAQAQSAGSASYDQAQAQRDLENAMELGYATGQRAFS
jgi:Zn-dependent protease with chaperone function